MHVQVLQPSPAGFVVPLTQAPASAGHMGGPTSGQFQIPLAQVQVDGEELEVPPQPRTVSVYGQVRPLVVHATPRPSWACAGQSDAVAPPQATAMLAMATKKAGPRMTLFLARIQGWSSRSHDAPPAASIVTLSAGSTLRRVLLARSKRITPLRPKNHSAPRW
jgi:hypothetical protein